MPGRAGVLSNHLGRPDACRQGKTARQAWGSQRRSSDSAPDCNQAPTALHHSHQTNTKAMPPRRCPPEQVCVVELPGEGEAQQVGGGGQGVVGIGEQAVHCRAVRRSVPHSMIGREGGVGAGRQGCPGATLPLETAHYRLLHSGKLTAIHVCGGSSDSQPAGQPAGQPASGQHPPATSGRVSKKAHTS